MPNWTDNTLIVQADTKKEIDNFLDKVIIDEEFDFNTIIPMPKEFEEGMVIFLETTIFFAFLSLKYVLLRSTKSINFFLACSP